VFIESCNALEITLLLRSYEVFVFGIRMNIRTQYYNGFNFQKHYNVVAVFIESCNSLEITLLLRSYEVFVFGIRMNIRTQYYNGFNFQKHYNVVAVFIESCNSIEITLLLRSYGVHLQNITVLQLNTIHYIFRMRFQVVLHFFFPHRYPPVVTSYRKQLKNQYISKYLVKPN